MALQPLSSEESRPFQTTGLIHAVDGLGTWLSTVTWVRPVCLFSDRGLLFIGIGVST